MCSCARVVFARMFIGAPLIGSALLATQRSCIGMVAWRPNAPMFVEASRSYCVCADGALQVVLLDSGPLLPARGFVADYR